MKFIKKELFRTVVRWWLAGYTNNEIIIKLREEGIWISEFEIASMIANVKKIPKEEIIMMLWNIGNSIPEIVDRLEQLRIAKMSVSEVKKCLMNQRRKSNLKRC